MHPVTLHRPAAVHATPLPRLCTHGLGLIQIQWAIHSETCGLLPTLSHPRFHSHAAAHSTACPSTLAQAACITPCCMLHACQCLCGTSPRPLPYQHGSYAPTHAHCALQATSLPRERVRDFQHEAQRYMAAHAAPDGRPPAAYGTQAVDSLGSGVRNMTVMEHNGAYPPPAPPAQGPVPMSGVLGQPASQQQSLLRSNSFQ